MPENGLKIKCSSLNQQKFISPSIIVFSKWSRKAYAVFASLGRLIKIGVLKADICQKALLKGLVNLGNIVKIEEDFEEDETALDTSVHDSLQFILSFLGLSVFQIINLTTIKISKKENPLRTILFSEYKVCFLQIVINRLFF
jgi:hypothetical protein